MNRLTLKLSHRKRFDVIVEMNGEIISPTCDDSSRTIYTYDTIDNYVDVRIYTEPNELLVHQWFLRYLLYYFISILGLFDWEYSANPYAIDYQARYNISDDTVLNFKWNMSNFDGVVFSSRDVINNETNIYKYSKHVKVRYVGMMVFKILSWIAIFVIIIMCNIK